MLVYEAVTAKVVSQLASFVGFRYMNVYLGINAVSLARPVFK